MNTFPIFYAERGKESGYLFVFGMNFSNTIQISFSLRRVHLHISAESALGGYLGTPYIFIIAFSAPIGDIWGHL